MQFTSRGQGSPLEVFNCWPDSQRNLFIHHGFALPLRPETFLHQIHSLGSAAGAATVTPHRPTPPLPLKYCVKLHRERWPAPPRRDFAADE